MRWPVVTDSRLIAEQEAATRVMRTRSNWKPRSRQPDGFHKTIDEAALLAPPARRR